MSADAIITHPLPATQPETFAPPAQVYEVVGLYLQGPARELDSFDARQRVLRDFARRYGLMTLREAKPYHLQLWIDAHPQWLSGWTRRRAIAGVEACFNWATKLGIVDRNPFKGFSTGPGERGEPMTEAEYQGILRVSRIDFRRYVIALRFSGARPGEIAKATLEDVDLERCCIELKKHKTAKKSGGKPRRIILHPVLLAYVRWRVRQSWPTNLLFPNSRWRMWSNPAICWRLKRARAKGLIRPQTSLYGLRHLCCTQAIIAGVSFPVVAEIMGHARIATTMIYSHVGQHTGHLQNAIQLAFQRKPA